MKRKYVPIYKVAKVAGYDEFWQVDFDNMGWCKDGTPCYTLKYPESKLLFNL